jgi:hypothetical protein
MYKLFFVFMVYTLSMNSYAEQKTSVVDPKNIQSSKYVHQSLPTNLLKRIKSITDVFETVDGVSYEQAVDLYKRNLNPEKELVIFEEIARVYKSYCKFHCKNKVEKEDVYELLITRSMFTKKETLLRFKPMTLRKEQIEIILNQYTLAAEPIDVIIK